MLKKILRDLTPHRSTLRQHTRTDPDPRARNRADAVLLVVRDVSLTRVAAQMGCSRNRVHTCAERFLAEGCDGLIERPQCGLPRKLDAAARELFETALAEPLDYDYPGTIWTVADLRDLLMREGYQASPATVYRTLDRLGYHYHRPRHDLTHRQDAEAVASAKHVLAELQKKGRPPELDSGRSTWMNAATTSIPTWQRQGSAEAVR